MTNFALEGPIWTKPVVTWCFAGAGNTAFTGAVDPVYQASIRAAAAQWSAVTNLTLHELPAGTSGSDITVGWGSFGGAQIGQTEYSYHLGTPPAFQAGMTIHLEDPSHLPISVGANATYQGTATTLYQVALHEFGHALGLGLSSDPASVMNLRLGPNNTAISASDLAGIAALYGAKANVAQTAASTSGSDTVTLSRSNIGVYRVFDDHSGAHLPTSSVNEVNTIFSTQPGLKPEGLALAGIAPSAADPNAGPVYRFFEAANGAHFLAANKAEAATIAATRNNLFSQQPSFAEQTSQQTGDVPVYRFFDLDAASRFLTATEGERGDFAAIRPNLNYEGVAFYAPAAA